MTFGNPVFLQLGAGLVLLTVLGLWSHMRRRRKLATFLGGPRAAARLAGTDLYRPRLERLLLLVAAAGALAFAAAEPSLPDRTVPPPPPAPAARVVFAVDVSASMQARDEAPTRLGRAGAVVEELLPTLEADRVGLVLFAGTPYPIAPPTHDHAALRYLLSGVTPTIASAWDPGSRPSVGVQEAVRLLTVPADSAGGRTIVLLSDGEAGEPAAAITEAVDAAAAEGIAVHVVALGSPTGAPMSMPAGPFQLGGPVVDATGTPARTRLREVPLRAIAEATGGVYAHATDAVALAALRARFLRPPPPALPSEPRTLLDRYDLSTLLAAAALLLLLAESLLDLRLPGTGLLTARSLARRST